MGVKLPDIVAACNKIKQGREYARRTLLGKTITIPLRDFDVSIKMTLNFNKNTDCVTLSHYLGYNKLAFHPTTNQKLRCTNQHALAMLKQQRDLDKKRYWKKRNVCKTVKSVGGSGQGTTGA